MKLEKIEKKYQFLCNCANCIYSSYYEEKYSWDMDLNGTTVCQQGMHPEDWRDNCNLWECSDLK